MVVISDDFVKASRTLVTVSGAVVKLEVGKRMSAN